MSKFLNLIQYVDENGVLQTINNNNIQKGIGKSSTQQTPDPKYNGVIKAATKNPYAKILDTTLTDSEPIGAIADYSIELGGNSSVQAKRGIGGGTSSVVKGAYSQSLGDNSVTTSKASDSTAIGYQTTTDAPGSFAHGCFTVVLGQQYVEGMFDPSYSDESGSGSATPADPSTTPADTLEMDSRRGEAASAGGFNSYASGFASEANGISSVADGHVSRAGGRSNRSWSYLSKTDGKNSVVKPDDTNSDATGEGSWANGDNVNIVGAKYAYSGGFNNNVYAGADNSFSYGEGLQVKYKNQVVIGQYNDSSSEDIFNIGVGSSDARASSFRATKDGKIYYGDTEVINTRSLNNSINNLNNILTPKITENTNQINSLWTTLRETNTNLNTLNTKVLKQEDLENIATYKRGTEKYSISSTDFPELTTTSETYKFDVYNCNYLSGTYSADVLLPNNSTQHVTWTSPSASIQLSSGYFLIPYGIEYTSHTGSTSGSYTFGQGVSESIKTIKTLTKYLSTLAVGGKVGDVFTRVKSSVGTVTFSPDTDFASISYGIIYSGTRAPWKANKTTGGTRSFTTSDICSRTTAPVSSISVDWVIFEKHKFY